MPRSLPNNKILESAKLKAFAVDKLFLAQITVFVFKPVENIVEKKGRMLVNSILYFYHVIFRFCHKDPGSFLSLTQQRVRMFRKGGVPINIFGSGLIFLRLIIFFYNFYYFNCLHVWQILLKSALKSRSLSFPKYSGWFNFYVPTLCSICIFMRLFSPVRHHKAKVASFYRRKG